MKSFAMVTILAAVVVFGAGCPDNSFGPQVADAGHTPDVGYDAGTPDNGPPPDTGCVPSCEGKGCGDDDGCGQRCTGCPTGMQCELHPSYAQCVAVPDADGDTGPVPECTKDADCAQPSNVCLKATCDETAGKCMTGPCNAIPCDDGNACTAGDTCNNGVCVGGAAVQFCCNSDAECGSGHCVDHVCVGGCTQQCANKNCGDDGCGGTCGSCGDGYECGPSGTCDVIPSEQPVLTMGTASVQIHTFNTIYGATLYGWACVGGEVTDDPMLIEQGKPVIGCLNDNGFDKTPWTNDDGQVWSWGQNVNGGFTNPTHTFDFPEKEGYTTYLVLWLRYQPKFADEDYQFPTLWDNPSITDMEFFDEWGDPISCEAISNGKKDLNFLCHVDAFEHGSP